MQPPQSPKIFPSNHKTVFLLDHTPYFGISCGVQLEFGYTKGRPGFIPLSPISKSLWTCAVEAAVDYCRIVWDLFPEGKLIRFVISDNSARALNTWAPDQQNIYQVFGSLSGIGAPPKLNANTQTEFSVIHGFRTAVEAMCECSEAQHRKRTSLTENAMELQNRCRMICVTSARDNESVKNLEDIFLNELNRTNRVANASDHLFAVDHCHLIIINVFPNSAHSSVTGHPPTQRSPTLTTEVYSVAAGNELAPKMTDLLLAHYDLASTTVIGIPMKEEQNASSSANYNVELFHAADAHTALLKSNLQELSQISALKEGASYETVTLKWCTPRNNNVADLHNCTTLHRITPAEVNSRPSACLITFLLNGRTVALETPRKMGTKGMSHILTSYGGEIFIQTLNTGRSVLEDPPAISDGVGGRVTDYRIADFGLLMRQNRLVPLKRRYFAEKTADSDKEADILPLEKSKKRLEKFTKYWPLTMSSNLIFNYKQLTEPLLSNMLKDELTQEEILQCKQCIYNLISMEAKNEPLPSVSSTLHRGKGPKREEQYKALWAELETYVKLHTYSKDHNEIISCLIECRKKPESIIKMEKNEIDQALKGYEHDREQMMQRETVIRTTFESPLSPTSNQANGVENGKVSMKHMSVYKYFMSKKKRNEKLAGELKAVPTSTGYITKLYPQLHECELPQPVKAEEQ